MRIENVFVDESYVKMRIENVTVDKSHVIMRIENVTVFLFFVLPTDYSLSGALRSEFAFH